MSADLGTHESLKGNASALATVTAIIDGTGSLGAAVGPMLTGYLSQVPPPHAALCCLLDTCPRNAKLWWGKRLQAEGEEARVVLTTRQALSLSFATSPRPIKPTLTRAVVVGV